MKQVKLTAIIVFSFILLINFNAIYANNITLERASLMDTIFSKGKDWFGSGSDEEQLGKTIADYINDNVFKLVGEIGNLVFFIVAAFLGVKYIWAGVSGKTEVKETLPTFVVGAVFFYSAQGIYKIFSDEFATIMSGGDFQAVTGSIWGTVAFIVQILSIAGIIAVGLKYMISPADKKADLKKDLFTLLIGLIMVFSITNVLTFISGISGELFK